MDVSLLKSYFVIFEDIAFSNQTAKEASYGVYYFGIKYIFCCHWTFGK